MKLEKEISAKMTGINSILEKALKTKVIEVPEEPFAKAKEVKVVEEIKPKPKVDPRVYG